VEAEASVPFCSAIKHAFCADFDTGALADGWTHTDVESPGAVTLSTDTSVSPARSFLSTMARRASTDPFANAALEIKFGGWHHMVVEFDFLPKTPDWIDTDVNSGLFALSFFGDNYSDGLALSMGHAYTTLGTPGTDISDAPLPTEAWLHAHVDFDPAGKVDATFGTIHFIGTFAALPNDTNQTTALSVGINGYNQPAPQYRVYYDNVTVDFP
jgi:hypothetical protein